MADKYQTYSQFHSEADSKSKSVYWFRRAAEAFKKAKIAIRRNRAPSASQPAPPSASPVEKKPYGFGDAKSTWTYKPGAISHAEKIGRPGRTVCGLKIGRRWLRAGGRNHPGYQLKCPRCRSEAR